MQKVLGVNLNGNGYQVEEQGYESLRAYLDRAQAQLANNPDRAEIVADLEQAIAEKCNKVLGPHKTVVTAAEIERILSEMGPVDSGDARAQPSAAENEKSKDQTSEPTAPKRLYQIREGAMIAGICNGIAAYLGVDVTFVRIAFVLLAILTKGIWLAVYGVLMFVIPRAETSEEHAAAHGRPFNAQELIDQARRNYADFTTKNDWKRHWRRQQREWRRQWRHGLHQAGMPPRDLAYSGHPWATAAAPMFGLAHAALALLFIFALWSVATTHAVFGIPLPSGLPIWAGFLIVIVVYQAIASPFLLARRAAFFGYPPPAHLWIGPGLGILWLGFVAFSIWYGYNHVPEVHDFIDKLPGAWNAFVHALQS